MPFYRLVPGSLDFPSPHLAGPDGLLAIGGDFQPERMLAAYSQGIFPWMVYSGEPVWFSPDPRMVLEPRRLHMPRSLSKLVRRGDFEIRIDTAFAEVMRQCAEAKRPGQRGSWITPGYMEGLEALHARGRAHSAEAWQQDKLVGGLYGLSIGKVFFGESMFTLRPDASKIAFATFVRELAAMGTELIDCQQETEHLKRFGAEAWPRARFLGALGSATVKPSEIGRWRLQCGPWDGHVRGWPFVGEPAAAETPVAAAETGEEEE